MLKIYDNHKMENEIGKFLQYPNKLTYFDDYDVLAKVPSIFIKWNGNLNDLPLVVSIIRSRFENAGTLDPEANIIYLDLLMNQQADRSFNGESISILKETINIINNSLADFQNYQIQINDPHNEPFVIARLKNYQATQYTCIDNIKNHINLLTEKASEMLEDPSGIQYTDGNFYFVFPDEGAYLKYEIGLKKLKQFYLSYNDMLAECRGMVTSIKVDLHTCHMKKIRDIHTREIISSELIQPKPIEFQKDSTIFIIDDICITGGSIARTIRKCLELWENPKFVISVSHKDFEKYKIPLDPDLVLLMETHDIKFA